MKTVFAMTLLMAFTPAAAQVSPAALRRLRSPDLRKESTNLLEQPTRRNMVDAEPGLGRDLEEEEMMSMKIVDGSADDGHVHDHQEEPAPEGEREIVSEFLDNNSCTMTSPALIASTVGGVLFLML